MNQRKWLAIVIGVLLILAVPLGRTICYTVSERELAVLLQFGQPVASRTDPGLYFKLPFVQEVLRLPKTLQVWHGSRQSDKLVDVPTADGKKVEVTVWAVWRITDPVQFVKTLRTVSNAESRVKEFVRSMARDTITTHNLAESVRSTNRKMTYTLGLPPEMVAAASSDEKTGPASASPAKDTGQAVPDFVVPPEARESVSLGRLRIMDQIKQDAQRALAEDGNKEGQSRGRGIELVDVGLSRIEFVPQVREAAFDRAVSLMEAIATKTISEGEQRKKEIINKTGAEVQKIEGEGKQEANVIKGKADAEIIDSYARAIRETGEFYNFIRTLEVYKESLKGETRLILTTDSALLKLIKTLEPLKQEPRPSPVASSPAPEPGAAATTTAASSARK
jgi:membrane protease subunit HflC